MGKSSMKTSKRHNGFQQMSTDHTGPTKPILDWGPEDVRLWLNEEGFPEFWNILRSHNPTGIDLLMLKPDDWQSLFSHTTYNNEAANCRPNVLQINRLFFQINRLKLSLGLPLKYPNLSFCMTGNASGLTGRNNYQRTSMLKVNASGDYSQSTDDDLEADILPLDNHPTDLEGPHPIESPHEVLPNGVPYHDSLSDTDLDDEDETGLLSHPGHNIGACPFCHHEIKREKLPIEPEHWKALLAFLYAIGVSWVTAFVMVIVHDRVPDMEKYPPLPDILLDNIPHIPWAFEMCEFTGMILVSLWCIVLLFHKHRFILMRRFFSISGTIFLLRCVTMLITSLSVPGKHLDCSPRPYGDIWNKLYNAYVIWTGAGMTLQGVRTCGDYMFSGHTVALTLLNFFITEYTSRKIYFLHTLTWICNVFGIFFILAAHEHYSIDVFVAFYITSRLFMYYHTLANQPVMQSLRKKSTPTIGHFSYDAHRTWLWFPMFSFFESKIDGKIPNEFAWPVTLDDLHAIRDKLTGMLNHFSSKAGQISNKMDNIENMSKKYDGKTENIAKPTRRNKKKIY